jgi:acyl-CoA thioester hydrolase
VSIFLRTGRVKAEWTDYNSHMNLAYYIHLFDVAWEILLEKFNMGEESSINQRKSTFAVESHTTYNQEVQVGEEVDLNLMFLDHDKKRIVYKLEMIHKEKKYLAATSEILSLYVDLNHRKVVEFEKEKSDLMDAFIEENKQDFNPGELHLIKKLKK